MSVNSYISDIPDNDVDAFVVRYSRYLANKFRRHQMYDDIYSTAWLTILELAHVAKLAGEQLPTKAYVSRVVYSAASGVLRSMIDIQENESPFYLGDDGEDMFDNLTSSVQNMSEAFEVVDILRNFDGRELLIVKEILMPSEKLCECTVAYTAKFTAEKTRTDRSTAFDKAFWKALQVVYGISENQLKWARAGIKKRIETLFGHSTKNFELCE